MQSTTPEYLDCQRKTLKRTPIFEDATCARKQLKAQPLTQDVIEVVQGMEMLTTQMHAIVDWTDLDTEPQDGDVLHYVKRCVSYEVVSYKLLGDGFCRLVLRNP